MTREEAIEILQEKHDECKAFYDLAAHPEDTYPSTTKYLYSLDMAIAALRSPAREQVEKVWRGEWEWYDEEVGSPLEGIEREWGWRCSKCKTVLPDEFDNPDDSPAMRFCPHCGAPMTDEAMEMVMERLEVLYEKID